MTASTSVHSNAFNFLSYVQSGVDPRTGQYTVAITLPDVKTNGLRGPGMPLALNYNPLNRQDSGFGLGWNLQLSQYDPGNQIVSLSSGETFKVDGTGNGQMLMSEKKIDSFHLYKEDDNHYRVMHKSGLVEQLEMRGSGTNRVALPVRVFAPEGHSVTLGYASFGGHQMLSEIKDDSGQILLGISRDATSVKLRMTTGEGPEATFVMVLGGSDHHVNRIELPTDNAASWRFAYSTIREHLCITSVETPVGGREEIFYTDSGHQFPARASRAPLPRVTRHRTTPCLGQAQMDVYYSYQDSAGRERNFLGAGLDIAWEDNGLDNLYRYLGAEPYEYSSTETLRVQVAGQADAERSIERTFNQFHLLTRETTRKNLTVMQVDTRYYIEPGQPFLTQPAYCQLPKEVQTTWRLSSDGSVPRSETVGSTYDNHGNLLTQTQPNGRVEVSEWYPAAGEDGCPPDPEGFVRWMKSSKVIPAVSGYGKAPVLVTRYRYLTLPAVDGGQLQEWLAPQSETLLMQAPEGEQEQQRTTYEYFDEPNNAALHGRLKLQQVIMGGKETSTAYAYSIPVRPLETTTESAPQINRYAATVLQTVQTVTGFDGAKKVITLEDSLLNGEPLLNRDDNNVEIRYVYDSLRRVLSETVAPNDETYKATRSYEYQLCARATDQAMQTLIDVKGVKTSSHFDGLNRVIYEERDDADNPARADKPRQTYAAVYDAWGLMVSETEFDWLGQQDLALKSVFEYDDWGEQRCVTGPDNVKTFEETDPIGTVQSQGPIQLSWIEGNGGGKSELTETWMNLFEQPTRSERKDRDENSVSLSQYHYDGLGRRVEDIVGEANGGRRTTSVYDVFDRVIESTLPSRAIVRRSYAGHSSEDLPVSIGIEHNGKSIVLGEQAFDGLDRLVCSVTGGRKRTLVYDPGLLQPKTVTLPSKRKIDYEYKPQVGDEPWRRVQSEAVSEPETTREVDPPKESGPVRTAEPGVAADYSYDEQNARLIHSSEQGEVLDRAYYSTGSLKSEKRTSAGKPYEMFYSYSRLGRLLSYTDVLGQEQVNRHDSFGRLYETSLGEVYSTFDYDTAFGRLAKITTTDKTDSRRERTVAISLEYDDLGREVTRTFDLDGVAQQMVQVYDDVDDMVQRTLSQGTEILRDETYRYDTSGRLIQYQCTGTQRPVDAYGRTLLAQNFIFDGANNLTIVTTRFDGGTNNARYFYEGDDPVQLSRVENSNEEYYPPEIKLHYDLDGNLDIDEAGRTLKYDPIGRLIEVGTSSAGIHYQYDPQDQLTGETRGGDRDLRFYRDGELANQLGNQVQSTFMRGDDYLLAEQQSDHTLLLATDGSNSVLGEMGGNGVNRRRYTAYGHASGEALPLGKLGFNGELAEADTGWQMLGNGYRAYSPVLMRFNSPDSWSPFGEGGVNGYVYVEGDPVNGVDPTGHLGLFTPLKLLYRALKKTPTLTTKSPGVEKIPALLTSRGGKEVTKLSKIKLTDWDSLKEVVDSYPGRITEARNNFTPKLADSLALKQVEAQESLNYVVGNFGEPGITAHARRTIAKELSLARKELKKIPTVKNIRRPDPLPRGEKGGWLNGIQKKSRFGFNPDN
ncbi:RHS repeat domain-containing protein [Pseudomonas cannabina]|nr:MULTISPECIES: RHS repeat-associated core domain-containing protein [Pseudomonas syringae group]KPB77789.1 YD repeat-containing protein [Pseudomonas syringae pv. maculicola]QQN20259.1 RHS repeat-associated core domain-containing protein [Pseudomonas cannabina pv. alisalensis]RMO05162.1 YD repeat-containing protein [Pseudomonas cannabina]